jgi:hypothetical protein
VGGVQMALLVTWRRKGSGGVSGRLRFGSRDEVTFFNYF